MYVFPRHAAYGSLLHNRLLVESWGSYMELGTRDRLGNAPTPKVRVSWILV